MGIFTILLGIFLLIWGGVEINTYIRYYKGVTLKATVIEARQKEAHGDNDKEATEITYRYEIDGKAYTDTKVSRDKKFLFKTHSMKGEFITIMASKDNPYKTTLGTSQEYLKKCIYLVVFGIITIVLGLFLIS